MFYLFIYKDFSDFYSIKFAPSGMFSKRTESAFFGVQIFKKLAIKYPDFGVFLPLQNSETLVNSHFQILKV